MEPIRLLLLDDHILFRESLSRLLSSQDGLAMVASCGTPAEALEVLRKEAVDVVLLDFDLEDDLGTRFIAASRNQGYTGKILMVTAGMSAPEIALAFSLGASGVFLKHDSPATLVEAIRTVVSGGMWQAPEHKTSPPAPAQGLHLTPREEQVLRFVFEGLPNKEIGARLGVSESAVKATLQQLFHKTGVRTRGQLVRVAIERSIAMDQPS